jgi:non-canonical purine NTP pyrophosphatase (RdgB/HAM1 family)
MAEVTFITGNQKKAEYLAKYLGFPVEHQKVDVDEIQSLDLEKVVRHKVRQAYAVIGKPVIVEDVSLEFKALGKLPGTFIKWFIAELGFEKLCRLVDGKERGARARCIFGYYDGSEERYFEGGMDGAIAEHPGADNGYGWDMIFIPKGYQTVRSELNEADDRTTYLQIKPLEAVKKFLETK